MAGKKLTVVISQAQGKHPAKLHLEEELAAALLFDDTVDVSIVPHLYDLHAEHSGITFLKGIPGPILVLSWLYPRAARWILDRQGIRGTEGETLLVDDDDPEDDEAPEPKGIGSVDAPKRPIWVLDLKLRPTADDYLAEIRRIAASLAVETVPLMNWIGGSPKKAQLERYLEPQNLLASAPVAELPEEAKPEPARRRWYPVIDYSRCTNCMECIDFCLFGVYGIDKLDRILVEQQDNCKKGCPACSRVCPENAIIFAGHKDSAIAGASGEVAGLKVDLSKLFGAPADAVADPLSLALKERDAELLADGRDAVGASVGVKSGTAVADRDRDDLDDLMDDLDALDF